VAFAECFSRLACRVAWASTPYRDLTSGGQRAHDLDAILLINYFHVPDIHMFYVAAIYIDIQRSTGKAAERSRGPSPVRIIY